MTTEVSDLSSVHAAIQACMNDLIAVGIATDDVIEAALTVSVTNKMTAHGPRETARALLLVAEFLAAQANVQDRSAHRDGH